MFQPIPEPSATSGFLRIKQDEKHRIRIMGTSKEPSSFIQGWEAIRAWQAMSSVVA